MTAVLHKTLPKAVQCGHMARLVRERKILRFIIQARYSASQWVQCAEISLINTKPPGEEGVLCRYSYAISSIAPQAYLLAAHCPVRTDKKNSPMFPPESVGVIRRPLQSMRPRIAAALSITAPAAHAGLAPPVGFSPRPLASRL